MTLRHMQARPIVLRGSLLQNIMFWLLILPGQATHMWFFSNDSSVRIWAVQELPWWCDRLTRDKPGVPTLTPPLTMTSDESPLLFPFLAFGNDEQNRLTRLL